MKRSTIAAVLATVFFIPPLLAEEGSTQTVEASRDSGTAYVVPIKGEITQAMVYMVRRAVTEAEREEASVVIFDMHTPGGRVDSAEEIMRMITGIRTPTYTFVNWHALSAGAFVAIATDRIFMTEDARIGSAAVISASPFGTPMAIPTNLMLKVDSDIAALVRGTAERKNYDVKLIEAMVNPTGYKAGEIEICEPGKLLTLTSREAAMEVETNGVRHALLSSGTVKNVEEILQRTGKSNYRILRMDVTTTERIAQFLDTILVRAILLGLGLLCVYIEFKTPGFGIPGFTGIALLTFWFWGRHIAGLAGFEEIVIFAIGLILLGIEIFVLPGFGFVGVLGVILALTGLIMAMVEHYPAEPWYRVPQIQIQGAVMNMGVSLLISFVLGALIAKYLPQTRAFRYVALTRTLPRTDGYQASGDAAAFLGLVGTAATRLRPSGIGVFGEHRLDVVTRGDHIDKGAAIVIAETHGNRIVVEKRQSADSAA